MSGIPCERVRESLLEGVWEHEHLDRCAACRRYADAVALVDGGLQRGPMPDPAPATLRQTVVRRALLDQNQRQRRALGAAACVTGLATVGGLTLAYRLLPGLTLPVPTLPTGPPATDLLTLLHLGAEQLAGGATALTGLLYALLGAGLVRLLSWEP